MELWDSIKRANIWVLGVQEKLKDAKEVRSSFKEIITDSLPKLERGTHIWIFVQEGQWSTVRLHSVKSTQDQWESSSQRLKTEFSEQQEEKLIPECIPILVTADCSGETSKTRRKWSTAEGKTQCLLGIMWPVELSFRDEGEMKRFFDKPKLKIYHHQTCSIISAQRSSLK